MKKKGSILIVVMFVMAVLSIVAVSFAYRANVYTRSDKDYQIHTKLKSHAASAVAIAMGRLLENNNDFDHRAEPWCTHAPLASEDWLPEWSARMDESSTFVADYQVIDEESKLNIAFASSDALETLGLSAAQANSLFDWIDSDNATQADGAESDYYLTLPNPYLCKNAPVEVLSELLLIRHYKPSDYWGEDVNHNRSLDQNENDGGATYPYDNADGRLRLGIVDVLTCRGDGRVNINTAPKCVLLTLPISEGSVDQILAYRAYDQDSGGDIEDHVFRSEEDIEQLQGLSLEDIDVLKGAATFKSTHFRMFAVARHTVTGLEYRLEVLISVEGDRLNVLEWRPW